jgi:hypothetical protein
MIYQVARSLPDIFPHAVHHLYWFETGQQPSFFPLEQLHYSLQRLATQPFPMICKRIEIQAVMHTIYTAIEE